LLANQPPLRGRVREQARSYEKPCSPTTCRSGPCPRYRAQGALLHGDDCGWGRVGADLIREARRRFRPSRTRSACPCFPSNRLAGCAEALFIGWVEPWRNPCGGGDGYRFAQPILRGVVFAGGVGADSVRDPADNAGGRGQEHPHPALSRKRERGPSVPPECPAGALSPIADKVRSYAGASWNRRRTLSAIWTSREIAERTETPLQQAERNRRSGGHATWMSREPRWATGTYPRGGPPWRGNSRG